MKFAINLEIPLFVAIALLLIPTPEWVGWWSVAVINVIVGITTVVSIMGAYILYAGKLTRTTPIPPKLWTYQMARTLLAVVGLILTGLTVQAAFMAGMAALLYVISARRINE